jgi:hypothetical protein
MSTHHDAGNLRAKPVMARTVKLVNRLLHRPRKWGEDKIDIDESGQA